MNIFEGYVGIRLWDGQLVDDVIFSLLLFLFIVFSFVFRTNFQLFVKMLKDAYEEAKQLLSNHRQALDKIAAFLIEKETITGKEFMEIFHEVEGIDPDAPKKEEARIGMNPVEGEGFVMKPADDIDDAHNADEQEKSEKTEEKTVGTATESVHEE